MALGFGNTQAMSSALGGGGTGSVYNMNPQSFGQGQQFPVERTRAFQWNKRMNEVNNPQSSMGQIQTSIPYEEPYSPYNTQLAVNQSAAKADQSNLSFLLGQAQRGSGFSQDSGSVMSRVLPQFAQAQQEGNLARFQIPFQDTTANRQHQLRQEVAREQQALGAAGVESSLDATNRNYQIQSTNFLSNALRSLGGF